MRDQYAGDLNDVLKFALLRVLSANDRRLGVAWYYDPGDDGRPDGRHLEWRDEPAWHRLDPVLHTGLATLPQRSLAALEAAAIWPGRTVFHREPVPPRPHREAWATRKRTALAAADLVFLDPDTGIGNETRKHATIEEIRLLRRPHRTVVVITFPGRSHPHDVLVQQLHDRLSREAGSQSVLTLRTSVSVPATPGASTVVQRQRWFTLIDPSSELTARTHTFAHALAAIPRVRTHIDGVR